MLKSILREKPLWLLVFLGVLYYYRPLFLGETFFFRDLYSYFLPQKQLLVDYFKTGELPLWNPYLHGGQAYLPNIANAALYPFNLLYFVLPLFRAFNLNIVVHIIGCAVCAYLFARVIGLRPVSSFIVGLLYGFCGVMASLVNVLNLLLAMPYLPLLFVFWHCYLVKGKKIWFVAAVLTGVIQVLPGAPEVSVISLLSLLGWTLVSPYSQRIRRRIAVWGLLIMCITGIAAIQLFPMVEVVSQSFRGGGLDYGYLSPWSLYPKRLPELILPNFFGHIDTIRHDEAYWGTSIIREEAPYLMSIYVGGIPLIFALFGALNRKEHRALTFRVRMFLCGLLLLSICLSFGRFLPFFQQFSTTIPFMTIFRYPVKFLIAGLFPLALLAGYASEVYFDESRAIPSPRSYVDGLSLLLWGIAALLAIGTGLLHFSDNAANIFQEWFFGNSGSDVMRDGLQRSFAHGFGIWLTVTLVYQHHRLRPTRWQQWSVAAILTADLFVAGIRGNPLAPEELFSTPPPIIQIIQEEIGAGRLFRTKNPPQIKILAPSDHVMWTYQMNLEILEPYLAAYFRIPVIFHRDLVLLAPTVLMEMTQHIESLPWEQRLPLLSAGGVTLILTPDTLTLPDVHYVTSVSGRGDLFFHLYRNERAMPRAVFVSSWETVSSDREALEAMLAASYDSRKHVVLQTAELSSRFAFRENASQSQPTRQNSPQECDSARVHHERLSNHSGLLSVSAPCSGYLVFTEPFYSGWNVRVDGKAVPIRRANYAFSAIFLEAGDHQIERRYFPDWLLYGITCSLFFCGVLLFIVSRWSKLISLATKA